MKRSKLRFALCWSLIGVNLLFIWGNSLMSGEMSAAFSSWVKAVLEAILPAIEGQNPQQSHGLIRKLAHFTEFFTLGCLFTWLVLLYRIRRPASFLMPAVLGAGAACVDETIQLFVPGRGPAIFDVGIDTLGAVLGVVLISFIQFIKTNKNTEDNKT